MIGDVFQETNLNMTQQLQVSRLFIIDVSQKFQMILQSVLYL